jgi:NAD-dependent deacetylase
MNDWEPYRDAIDQAAAWLRGCRSVLVITGAGISADSGLPTYRGIGGLYNSGRTDEGLPIEQLLSGGMLRRRPELTWKYLLQIEQACRGAHFNRAHTVVAEMERQLERVWVLTQNVDGFHRQAGSQKVIDIHGDLHDLKCTVCEYRQTVESYAQLPLPPRCPECRALVRPDVVLFGELLPADKLEALFDELGTGFDLVFSVGTTSVFPYIAEPVRIAVRDGRPTVEINPGPSEVSGLVDLKLPLGAALALDAIWSRYGQLDR